MCNKKTFEKIFSRAYSALAHEDVSTISTVLFSWPSAVAMGGSVIAVPGKKHFRDCRDVFVRQRTVRAAEDLLTQAFTALQLRSVSCSWLTLWRTAADGPEGC